MSNDHKNTEEQSKDDIADSMALDLNFVPDWARKPPQTNYFSQSPKHKDSHNADRNHRRDNRGPKSGKQSHNYDRNRSKGGQQRNNRSDRNPIHKSRRREPVEIPDVQVRFLPAQKAISEIARKIATSKRAYPMMQVAGLYLDNPEYCNARVEVNKGTKDLELLQCKICGMIATKEDSLNRHMIQVHMSDYMDKEEVQNELPTGSFSCIAQCGYSGELLGPPNHHSYSEKIRNIHNRSFNNMSLEKYSANIKTIHGEEIVAKWKEEYSRQTTYRPKSEESADSMSLSQAEAYFLENIANGKIQKTRRATLPVPLCREISDMGLQLAIKNEWMKENRFPASIMTALRGAFLSKGLAIFKTRKSKGKSITFVAPTKFSPINVEHVVDSIKEVLVYLKENPGSSRKQLIIALRPDAKEGSEELKEILSPLSWLIDRGHIIEFFDGTLSVPR